MALVLALDVYGTLVDTASVQGALAAVAGDRAGEASRAWRAKQLEYAFRRSLMDAYADFDRCTADALEHTLQTLGIAVDPAAKARLLGAYRDLAPYPGTAEALATLAAAGHALYAFSNGTPKTLQALLGGAGLAEHLRDIVSVDEVGRYKPDPAVYAHFLARTGAGPARTWLVSANPFDVSGALNAGWRAAWIRRDERTPFDPWGGPPSRVVKDLAALAGALSGPERAQHRAAGHAPKHRT